MFSEGSKGKIGMKRFRKSISVIRKIWVQIFALYFEMLRKYERIFFLSFFSEKKKDQKFKSFGSKSFNCWGMAETITQRCSIKKLFLKMPQKAALLESLIKLHA